MQQPVRRQIDLAVRIEGVQQRRREQIAELREAPRQRDDQREHQIGEAKVEHQARFERPPEAPGATEREPAAEHEQKLPAERIEIPVAIRIGRQIPLELACRRVERDRSDHGQVRQPQHQPDHRRETQRQQGIELQHIEIERLRLQEQAMRENPDRMVDPSGEIEVVDDIGRGILSRDVTDQGDIGDEQYEVGRIELPRALEYPGRPDDDAALGHHLREVGESGVAGNEDEQIRSAAESVIPGRDQVHHIVGDVIEKDRPVRDAEKKMQAQIAIVGRKLGVDVHGVYFLMSSCFGVLVPDGDDAVLRSSIRCQAERFTARINSPPLGRQVPR